MSEHALEIQQVSKKFRKGEIYDSLRDWLPALLRKLARRQRGHKELSKREFWALRDVSFAVDRGEVVGIIGHNGAGKSTMLKLLSGVLKPTTGTIQVNGTLSALIEVGAGFHPDLTGLENIYLNGAILGMKRSEIAKKLDRIVDFSGLEEFLDTPVKRYSTGMYARLGFAVAAHVDPDILIVDEVLSVGDYVFQNKCMERMREVVRNGAAVIFVSHNLHAVADLCTRAILLDHGEVTDEGCPQEVIKTYLSGVRISPDESKKKEAFVSDLVIRGQHGSETRFDSGDDVWLDIEVKANSRCERLAVAVYLKDDKGHMVFATSTERLGYPTFTIEPGETVRRTFRLTLHLAPGAFHVGAVIHRYDIEKQYDERFPLGTMFVTSDKDIKGVANLYPEVVQGPAAHLSKCVPADQDISACSADVS